MREPHPAPAAEPKRVVVKSPAWSPDDEYAVILRARAYGDGVEVYTEDNVWIGTVGRYTGSLDTKIKGTRLRHEGKRRTLWSYTGTYDGARAMHGEVSRADCIRHLMAHERRQRAQQARPTPDQSHCDVGHHQQCSGYTEDESDPETCMCTCHDPEDHR